MDKEKWKFLNNEVLAATISAGLSRGYPVYKNGADEKQKERFKDFLRSELEYCAEDYKEAKVSEKQHNQNIKNLSDEISWQLRNFTAILHKERFRIGRTQKLLNLYLKYLWCLGQIPEPPHCPFDSIIAKKLGLNILWTKFDSMSEYRKLAKEAHREARKYGLSIAKWELMEWNKFIKQKGYFELKCHVCKTKYKVDPVIYWNPSLLGKPGGSLACPKCGVPSKLNPNFGMAGDVLVSAIDNKEEGAVKLRDYCNTVADLKKWEPFLRKMDYKKWERDENDFVEDFPPKTISDPKLKLKLEIEHNGRKKLEGMTNKERQRLIDEVIEKAREFLPSKIK